jgi:hypothetical protein
VAPDGSWLASVGDNPSVRVWDQTRGTVQAAIRVGTSLGVVACSQAEAKSASGL